MKLNTRWLKEILPKIPVVSKLCDKLTSIGLEVDSIKKLKSESIIDIEITPNRSDCLSVYGIARDLSAAYKVKPIKPKVTKFTFNSSRNIIKSVNKKISPHYTCLEIMNIDNMIKTPKFIKSRLLGCGITSINLVVDILNYVMIELGQPFHAFDSDRLKGKLSVRLSRKNETMEGLDDKKYRLEKNTPVIADQKKIQAIAGIIGSKDSAITRSSRNIIIECAYFLPNLIRSASKLYKTQTDSSYRFERGVNPLSHQESLKRVIYLLQKFTKYKRISSSIYIDKKLKNYNKKKIVFNISQFERILGQKVNTNEVVGIFKRLEFEVKTSKQKMTVGVPSHRFDIENDYDLIEEFARIKGYEKFLAQSAPPINIKKRFDEKENYSNKISTSLVCRGYNEIKSYSFLPKSYQKEFISKNSIISIDNPISEDKAELRTSLIPSLIRTYKYNANRQYTDLKIFEIGNIYWRENKTLISEKNSLAGLITGRKSNLSLKINSEPLTFFDLKGDLTSILPNLEFKPATNSKFFSDDTQSSILQNKKHIGYCGEISEFFYATESINEPVFIFEILVPSLKFPENVSYKELSPFPKVRRDLTILVDDKISGKDIIDIIIKQSYKHLINIKINDVFYDESNFGNDKKSISLEFQFQKRKSTLLDTEVNNVMEKVINLLSKKLDAQLRTT